MTLLTPGRSDPAHIQERPQWESVARGICFALLLTLTILNCVATWLAPVFDEPDLTTTLWQGCRILNHEQPFRDYTPIYGPGQQYALAAVMAVVGQTVYGARTCALLFALVSSALVYQVARKLGLSRMAGAVSSLIGLTLVLGSGAPQGSGMTPVCTLTCALLIMHMEKSEGRACRLLAVVVGALAGFALATKPNVGGALLVGTLGAAFWPVLGRGWRVVVGLACSLCLMLPLNDALPLASCVPYIIAPALLVAYALAGGPSQARPTLGLRARLSVSTLFAIGAVGAAVGLYHSGLTPEGLPGLVLWVARLARHGGSALHTALLLPEHLWPGVAAVVVCVSALHVVLIRYAKLRDMSIVIVITSMACLGVAALSGLRGGEAMRAMLLWCPAVLVGAYLERGNARQTVADVNGGATFTQGALAPLVVALLVSGSQGYDFNAFVLPCLLLMAYIGGSPRSEPLRLTPRSGIVLASINVLVAVVVCAVSAQCLFTLRTAGHWPLKWDRPMALQVFQCLPDRLAQSSLELADRYRPMADEAWLPEDVSTALGVLRAQAPGEAVFSYPYALAPALCRGISNGSTQDYWLPVYVTDDEVARDLRQLDEGDCRWALVRRWSLSFGPWRDVRESYIEDQQLSAGERLTRDHPQVARYFHNSGEWQCVLESDEAELWRRDK